MALNYRKSGVPSGGLGIYKATKGLVSPGASSLDKPAGTLSGKSVAQAGAAAQRLIEIAPGKSPDITVAQRSYTMADILQRSDVLLAAGPQLIDKFLAQATPAQRISLLEAAKTATTGVQREVLAGLRAAEEESKKEAAGILDNPLLILAGLFIASKVLK